MIHGNFFWGMHLVWWVLWFMMMVWIFATPYDIPGQRRRSASPLEMLRMRLASGQITLEQYREHKLMLDAGEMRHG